MNNKALLVGINKYPDPRNELRGCINDILDMETFISEQHTIYNKSSIKKLTDKQATKKSIVENLKWLIEGTQAGDQILFHYSGHGAQAPTHHPREEADGNDEIICPYDFDWSNETTLRDKEFAQLFSTIPKGVHFVWVSDSCHAEDLSRDMINDTNDTSNTVYRYFTGDKKAMNQTTNLSLPTITTPLNGILLSACESAQLSADAYIDNRFNGAFTHYLLKNLTKGGLHQPLQQTMQLANSDLSMNGFDQRPQFEGNLNQSSFFI